jgi:hypothetical protein
LAKLENSAATFRYRCAVINGSRIKCPVNKQQQVVVVGEPPRERAACRCGHAESAPHVRIDLLDFAKICRSANSADSDPGARW